MTPAEVYAGLSAIKSAFDMTKGLKDIHDVTLRDRAVIELCRFRPIADSHSGALRTAFR